MRLEISGPLEWNPLSFAIAMTFTLFFLIFRHAPMFVGLSESRGSYVVMSTKVRGIFTE